VVPDIVFNLISMGREQRKTIHFAHTFVNEVYIFVNILYYFSHYGCVSLFTPSTANSISTFYCSPNVKREQNATCNE